MSVRLRLRTPAQNMVVGDNQELSCIALRYASPRADASLALGFLP